MVMLDVSIILGARSVLAMMCAKGTPLPGRAPAAAMTSRSWSELSPLEGDSGACKPRCTSGLRHSHLQRPSFLEQIVPPKRPHACWRRTKSFRSSPFLSVSSLMSLYQAIMVSWDSARNTQECPRCIEPVCRPLSMNLCDEEPGSDCRMIFAGIYNVGNLADWIPRINHLAAVGSELFPLMILRHGNRSLLELVGCIVGSVGLAAEDPSHHIVQVCLKQVSPICLEEDMETNLLDANSFLRLPEVGVQLSGQALDFLYLLLQVAADLVGVQKSLLVEILQDVECITDSPRREEVGGHGRVVYDIGT
ncbi:hypothetical protein KCU88_g309, partial [Aureobasidium melanogenum]